MRSIVVFLFCSMLLAMVPTVAQQSGGSVGAKLFLEETTFDFGYIPAEATVSHGFYFYSRGTDSLKILNVKPG